MRGVFVVVVAFVAVTRAAAQPTACDACARGEAVIDRYGLQVLRPLAGKLATLALTEPLTREQYASVVTLRAQTPVLVKLGAIGDSELAEVAAALCNAQVAGTCTTTTALALRCLADRCAVQLPAPDPKVDTLKEDCHRYSTKRRSTALGVGFDWGNGVHTTKYSSDGRAWSLGIETRLRLGKRLGAVARVDRVAGRDAAEDADGDGNDDASTGSITRFSALGGPSFILDYGRFESTMRHLRVDLLGGYLATRSQANESGPAAGIDVGYQLSIVRVGARFVQGFGDAIDASTLLVHMGFLVGSAPELRDENDCGAEPSNSSTRLGIGLDIALGGYGVAEELGYIPTGLALEAMWRLIPRLDAITRLDLLLYPGDERERVIHQAALAGLRINEKSTKRYSEETGFFAIVMGGYTHSAGLTPTTAGSGPITDVAIGWGIHGAEGAANFRLHGRFGLSPDNFDYRAIFLSGGLELHLDPKSWRK